MDELEKKKYPGNKLAVSLLPNSSFDDACEKFRTLKNSFPGLNCFKLNFLNLVLFILFDVYEYFICMNVCTPYARLVVSLEVRRHRIP